MLEKKGKNPEKFYKFLKICKKCGEEYGSDLKNSEVCYFCTFRPKRWTKNEET